MILDKHTWVCSICGQGLTRKSTAIRHNNNLHSGGAMIVRPYEYIIGRLNGEFLQSDPSLYRHNRRDSINEDDNNRKGFEPLSFPGNAAHEHEYGNIGQQPTKPNDVMRTFYAESVPPTPHLQSSHKVVDVKTPDTVEKLSERVLKLKELELLANKLYPPQNAKQIIIAAGMQANAGNDDSLDKNLTFLRNVDRAKSY